MSINAVGPLISSVPYPGFGTANVLKTTGEGYRANAAEDVISLPKRHIRVEAIESGGFVKQRQERQSEQRRIVFLFSDRHTESRVRSLSTPQILKKLISQMGGTDVYVGPGRHVNIAV